MSWLKVIFNGTLADFNFSPLQVFVGDAHGLNTLEHQPAKLAAMEGHWETNYDEGMPLYLFGILICKKNVLNMQLQFQI